MPRLILVLFVLLFILTIPTTAQSNVNCDATNFTDEIIPDLQKHLDLVQQAVNDGDLDQAVDNLRILQIRASIMRSMCSGWSFSSETEGLQPVIGPVTFLNGTYRARITTEGFVIVKITTLAGDCGRDGSIFNESQGDAIDGAETVFQTAESCNALIEMSNITAPWTLEFEPIKLDE